jgi:hypothetical protein
LDVSLEAFSAFSEQEQLKDQLIHILEYDSAGCRLWEFLYLVGDIRMIMSSHAFANWALKKDSRIR